MSAELRTQCSEDGYIHRSATDDELLEDNLEIKKRVYLKPRPARRSKEDIEHEDNEILSVMRQGKRNKDIYKELVDRGLLLNGDGDVMDAKVISGKLSRLRFRHGIPKPNKLNG